MTVLRYIPYRPVNTAIYRLSASTVSTHLTVQAQLIWLCAYFSSVNFLKCIKICGIVMLLLVGLVLRYASKAIEFGEIMQNKEGCYSVQGHSVSPMSVPIERPCATSY